MNYNYGCTPFKLEDIDNNLDRFPLVLLDRGGNCSFVTKTRNVQNAGGHMAIIIDNSAESLENILLVDDGTGSDIRIPAVLISKSDGQLIKNYIIKNNGKKIESDIIISVEFKMVNLLINQ